MTSFFRVAWRDNQSHCTRDFDTREQAEAHVDRLKRTTLSHPFMYEIPLLEPADSPETPVTAPLRASGLIRRVLGRSNEGEVA